MAGYVVRRVRPDEWQAYRDLRLRALAGAPDAFGSTLEESGKRTDDEWRGFVEGFSDGDGGALFVVDGPDGASLVATCLVARSDDEPERAGVFAMWVDEGHRGHDLGARLLARVEEWAAARGHRYAALHVAEENSAAIGLYRASGYEPTGQQELLRPGSPIVTIELAKPLAGTSDRTTSA